MPRKQTRSEVSSLGARIMSLTDREMAIRVLREPATFFAEVRTLAASVVSQDETKGQDRDSRQLEASPAL